MMKRSIYIFIMMLAGVLPALSAHKVEDIPNVHVADRTRYVSNPDGVLSPAAVDSLDRMLGRVWQQTSAEPVVVAIDDFDDSYMDENTFATELFELWKPGKKDRDNGLLILLVRDRRRLVMRTGYGLEGVLPDITTARISRDKAVPYFKNGDYDRGMVAATSAVAKVLTDPRYAEELRSQYANDARHGSGGEDDIDLFAFMVRAGMVMAVAMLLWVIYTMVSSRKEDEQERWRRLNDIKPVALFVSFIGLGFPVVAYLLCVWRMKRLRDHKRQCPNCGNSMRKLDEVTDNEYLTPAQDLEERINSIDYDVWLCDACGEKDVIPYVNKRSSYTVCPRCGARACTLTGNRIIVRPTTSAPGRGERINTCRNCGNRTVTPYNIAKLAATPVVIVPGGGFGRGGGGGFSGGSFGGGMTGGGSSVGW